MEAMQVTVIGGIDRLGRHYHDTARKLGVTLRIFTRAEAGMASKLGHSQAVVLFTGNVSHQARDIVVRAARAHAIPVYQYHSCGVCTLRRCLSWLRETGSAASPALS